MNKMNQISNCIMILFVILLASCQNETQKADYAILSGKLENTKGGELSVLSRSGFEKVTNVKDDGTFLDTLHIEGGYYNIVFGKSGTGIYMAKGDKVNFEADENDFTASLKFSGDHSELNNYYVERARIESKFQNNIEGYSGKDEAEFTDLILADRKLLEEKLDAVSQVPQDIREKEKRHIYYNYLQNKYMYQAFYHARFAEKENYEASEEFMKELNELPLDRPDDFQYSNAYNYLITFMVVSPMAYEEYEKDKSGGYVSAANKAAMQLKNESLRNMVLFDNTEMRLPMSENKKEVYENYMKASTNDEQKGRITELYNYLSALEPGNLSPKFANYENYAGGTTSLEDLKGKYVYIDVWATWCGPCKAEIPFLQQVEEQYHDRNIEFVSISVDSKKDHDTWKQMVKEKELSGIQLFADKSFNSQFIQDYKIRGIPQFILLDPQSRIVASNAPRPSDEKLIELFDEHGI